MYFFILHLNDVNDWIGGFAVFGITLKQNWVEMPKRLIFGVKKCETLITSFIITLC